MATFLALAAVLALAVLTVLLRPLWRGARGVAVGIAVIVLASGALLYRIVGTPQALDPANLAMPETLGDAIAQLEAELERNPDQAEGWRLLGQALQREGQSAKARDAYAKASTLAPDDADIASEAAQARAFADDRRLFDAQGDGIGEQGAVIADKARHAGLGYARALGDVEHGHAAALGGGE